MKVRKMRRMFSEGIFITWNVLERRRSMTLTCASLIVSYFFVFVLLLFCSSLLGSVVFGRGSKQVRFWRSVQEQWWCGWWTISFPVTLFHDVAPWRCSMTLFHEVVPWRCSMTLFHDVVPWRWRAVDGRRFGSSSHTTSEYARIIPQPPNSYHQLLNYYN